MAQNELGALVFAGIILGAFFLIAIIYIIIGTYRQKKLKERIANIKTLQKQKENMKNLIFSLKK